MHAAANISVAPRHTRRPQFVFYVDPTAPHRTHCRLSRPLPASVISSLPAFHLLPQHHPEPVDCGCCSVGIRRRDRVGATVEPLPAGETSTRDDCNGTGLRVRGCAWRASAGGEELNRSGPVVFSSHLARWGRRRRWWGVTA
ncbi:RING-H2 finger protein ATL2-like [Sesbania bispinosa]|nr:RING-H2 finger protein ATL2-like [Sesbania bispinosa]